MTFSPLGKRVVSYVLTLEDNLQVLLPFAELTGTSHDIFGVQIFGIYILFEFSLWRIRRRYFLLQVMKKGMFL